MVGMHPFYVFLIAGLGITTQVRRPETVVSVAHDLLSQSWEAGTPVCSVFLTCSALYLSILYDFFTRIFLSTLFLPFLIILLHIGRSNSTSILSPLHPSHFTYLVTLILCATALCRRRNYDTQLELSLLVFRVIFPPKSAACVMVTLLLSPLLDVATVSQEELQHFHKSQSLGKCQLS